MEISQDLGHPNIVFIRFNPDAYEHNGKKILSCWKQDGNGICVVKDKKKWEERLSNLQNLIYKWKDKIPEKLITLEQLYLMSERATDHCLRISSSSSNQISGFVSSLAPQFIDLKMLYFIKW